MKLEEIEKLCDGLPPGKWSYYEEGKHWLPYFIYTLRIDDINLQVNSGNSLRDVQNCYEFAALSRELIPKLLAVAKEAMNSDWLHFTPELIEALEQLEKE